MEKQKKSSQPMSIRMSSDLSEKLKDFCMRSGQSKTTAIERALIAYIDQYDSLIIRAQKTNNKPKL